MKYLLRALALAITAVGMVVLIRVQSSQGRYQLIMSGYHTPTATPSSTPPGCTTFNNNGTLVQVGAACFPRSSCPAVTFPHDPAAFGADPTGVNDSSGAISQAIAAGVAQGGHGDIVFNTPGTYLVNLTTGGTYVTSAGVVPPANATVECGAAGVTLKKTLTTNHDIGIITLTQGGNTVCGCDFQGGNTGPSPKLENSSANGQWQVDVQGGSGYTIEGNTFENATGDSAAGASDNPSSNVTFTFNTCSANPLYCFVIDETVTGATISHNLVTDAWLGAEWDSCPSGGSVGTNLNFTNNEVNVVGGTCGQLSQQGCAGDGLVNGGPGYVPVGIGSGNACNYNGVVIGGNSSSLANYCTGTASITAAYGAVVNGINGTATVNNNIVGPNCVCNSGTGHC